MRPDGSPSAPAAASPRLDRTTWVVRLGLIVLTLTGLLTIFGEPLLLGPGAAADLAPSGPASVPAGVPPPSPAR